MELDNSGIDVLIIGGGPAGIALALTLKKEKPELSILIAEKTNYSELRIGETVPPQTQILLQRLDVWNDFPLDVHLPSYSTRSAWGTDTIYENEFIFIAQQKGWHLDRKKFDEYLSGEAEKAGIQILKNTRFLSSEKTPGGWTVQLSNEKGRFRLHAAFIADCSGRSSVFSKTQLAPKIFCDRLTGTVAFTSASSSKDTSTLVETFDNGWWYSTVLPNKKLVVACFTDSTIAKKLNLNSAEGWKNTLLKAKHTSKRMSTDSNPEWENQSTWAANSSYLIKASGEGWIAAGDSAQAVDPLSSQGIFLALQNGMYAAYAILDNCKGEEEGFIKYERLRKEQYESYLEVRRDFYRMEKRWSESPFWKSRQEYLSLNPRALLKNVPLIPGHSPLFLSREMANSIFSELPTALPAHELGKKLRSVLPFNGAERTIHAIEQLIEDKFLEIQN